MSSTDRRAGHERRWPAHDMADGDERVLTPRMLKLALVVVLGSIMTILDATIVNVGLAGS
jgi:hypothetical protein